MTDPAPRRASALVCSAAIAWLAGTAAAAQDGPTPPQFRQLATEPLSPTTVLSAAELEVGPGHTSPSHRHAGSVFVYVLEGDVRSRINDEPIVLYHAGDTWFEPEGAEHSLFENASDTSPARLLVIRVGPPQEQPSADDE